MVYIPELFFHIIYRAHSAKLRNYLHFLLLWCEAYLCCGDELFSWPHPQDGAIVTLAAMGELEGGEGPPGEGLT